MRLRAHHIRHSCVSNEFSVNRIKILMLVTALVTPKSESRYNKLREISTLEMISCYSCDALAMFYSFNEFNILQTKGDPGVSAFPDGDNLFKWIATLTGPNGTVRV